MSQYTQIMPTMIAAFKAWMLDNEMDLMHISVDARDLSEDQQKFLADYIDPYGMVRLSIGPNATRNHFFGEHSFEYDTKFRGVERHMILPYISIAEFYVRTGIEDAPEIALPFPNYERMRRGVQRFINNAKLSVSSMPIAVREPTQEELQAIEDSAKLHTGNQVMKLLPPPEGYVAPKPLPDNVIDFAAYRAKRKLKVVPGGKK